MACADIRDGSDEREKHGMGRRCVATQDLRVSCTDKRPCFTLSVELFALEDGQELAVQDEGFQALLSAAKLLPPAGGLCASMVHCASPG